MFIRVKWPKFIHYVSIGLVRRVFEYFSVVWDPHSQKWKYNITRFFFNGGILQWILQFSVYQRGY